jgi:hypothetical protein
VEEGQPQELQHRDQNGSGTDCPAPCAPFFHGRAGSAEGWGNKGTPRPCRAPLRWRPGRASTENG